MSDLPRTRRSVLAAALGIAASACGAARPPAASPAPPALRLDPIVDLVAAAGLVWLVDLVPHVLLTDPALTPVVAAAAPPESFDAFASRHAGLDLRRATEVSVASFGDTTLALARVPFEPGRVEAAFADRTTVDGRAVDRGVTRVWGTMWESVGDDRRATRSQVALLGHDALALERGPLGPLQTAVYFAQGRLRRSPRALQAAPLATVAERLGAAPLRAFAPGPFAGGPYATGLGGLLGAATAVGLGLSGATAAGSATYPERISLRVVLTGAWGIDAPRAAKRLAACYHILAEDPIGRLLGLDRPLEEPQVTADADVLDLHVALDPVAAARGVRSATQASVAEIMAF